MVKYTQTSFEQLLLIIQAKQWSSSYWCPFRTGRPLHETNLNRLQFEQSLAPIQNPRGFPNPPLGCRTHSSKYIQIQAATEIKLKLSFRNKIVAITYQLIHRRKLFELIQNDRCNSCFQCIIATEILDNPFAPIFSENKCHVTTYSYFVKLNSNSIPQSIFKHKKLTEFFHTNLIYHDDLLRYSVAIFLGLQCIFLLQHLWYQNRFFASYKAS